MTRLHVVGLPHTRLTDDFSWCAFTALTKTFSTMMSRLGYEVIVYGTGGTEAECAEDVVCAPGPLNNTPTVPEFTPEGFLPMNLRVIAEVSKRLEAGDIILLTSGWAQQHIAQVFTEHIVCEPLCGYYGVLEKNRVFPSYSWMHLVYGGKNSTPWACLGEASDVVIPHFMDPESFPEGPGGDYLLFCARLNEDKGINIAVEVSKRMGMELKIIGHGTPPEHGEYLGVVGPKERADLMGGAKAVLAPSLYCEPFCLVAVEAQMTGTPAITTDFGAFTETVDRRYRCRSIDEFCDAVEGIKLWHRPAIRKRALSLYSTDTVGSQYARYFERLS